MSKVDDELTRRFLRAERPIDDDGPFELFEGLERRRAHHERLRTVRAGALALAVIAATVVGFVGLRAVFDETTTDVGEPGSLPGNGEIVFVADAEDGRIHIFASAPDGSGRRQLTDGETLDSDAAVSPDGRAVAFARGIGPGRATIATVPIEGGAISWQASEFYDITDPAWSPDGSRIAFISHTADAEAHLYVAEVGTDVARHIPIDAAEPAHPTWSPDGTRIAVAAYRDLDPTSPEADLAIVTVDDGSLEWLEFAIDDGDEQAPAWSPDGSRIAFLRPGSEGHDVWTTKADGRAGTLIATAVDAQLLNDLDWSPDGTSLLVSDGDWIYQVDASTEGDPRENFVQLMKGFSPSWQPIPAATGPSPSASTEPSPAASPGQQGRDIGLGVRMCDLEVLDGIDWDGTGIDGSAWTGAPVDEDGRCASPDLVQHVVAVDRDGDGLAEQGSTSTTACLLCRPFATVDLNEDGVLELVVLDAASSTPAYSVYEVNRPGSERAEGVYPIIVIPPGAPEMDLDPNQRVRFIVGGDEGFSGGIECEDGPDGPILRYTWVRGTVDADTDLEVDVTRLRFGEDGVFKVLSTDSFSVPRDPEPTDLVSREPACGVDFHPDA